MRTLATLALVSLTVGLALCLPASAAQDAPAANAAPGVIIGVVADARKRPLPGVTLRVRIGATVQSVVSDARGRFRIAGLPLGGHRVVAELPGFRRTETDVELTARYPEADASFQMQVAPLEDSHPVPGPAPRYRVWPLGPETR